MELADPTESIVEVKILDLLQDKRIVTRELVYICQELKMFDTTRADRGQRIIEAKLHIILDSMH